MSKIKPIKRPKNKNPDSHFSWLIGTWKNEKTKDTYEEWKMDDQNEIVGNGFKLVKDEKVISENIRIFSQNDDYFYEATLPHSEQPVSFKIISISEFGFVCENNQYDFPKKISYLLNGYNQLEVKLLGFNRNLNFTFEKI